MLERLDKANENTEAAARAAKLKALAAA
jgi:hypothetical protein